MDGPSVQLQADLHDSIRRAFSTRRPVLTHLNADTSWLLQLPYPQHAIPASGRTQFNILIDPWLSGPQTDVASWFSTQYHVIPPSVGSIAELEDGLREVQEMTRDLAGNQRKSRKLSGNALSTRPYIDLVVISHEFTDHCHRKTLEQIDREVPVIATAKAAELIRSWKHFTLVQESPKYPNGNADWTCTSLWPQPDWLGISRLVLEGDALYLHSALVFIFDIGTDTAHDEAAEAIVYTPHGIQAGHLGQVSLGTPSIRTLALLHGLDDVSIGSAKRINLGAHNGLRLQRQLKAKYWVGTHDERKKQRGILAPFLWRKIVTFEEALKNEVKEKGCISDNTGLADMKDVSFVTLRSGESLLLD